MIVYGDPHFQASLRNVLRRLGDGIGAARTGSPDALRALLIRAGQLEQAAQDHWPPSNGDGERHSLLLRIQKITDYAATAFYSAWVNANGRSTNRSSRPHEALDSLVKELDLLQDTPDVELTVKVPEGFEFYGLYPEQYCASAVRWAAEHASAQKRRAVVVGIRSIGTSLSALIAVTLQAAGWQTHRFTVRPNGDAFRRKAEVRAEVLRSAEWALIADEGPGLSGSSMSAVAEALAGAGVKGERMAFFSGHDGEPGPAASPRIRRCWASTARYFTPLSQVQWNGLSLQDALLNQTAELFPGHEPCERIEDLGGGLWRESFWQNEADWPAAAIPFERPKYLCTRAQGRSILWKFTGLGAVVDDPSLPAKAWLKQMITRAKRNWTPQPLALFRGFVALPWIQGQPLTRADAATPGVLEQVGLYLTQAAGSSLSMPQTESALARLAEMLHHNTRQALGDGLAGRARDWSEAVPGWISAGDIDPTLFRSFGDGHLAPHEWVRDHDGYISKTDSFGHDVDHTIIGKQSIAWDIAGALSEWRLDSGAEARLLAVVQKAGLKIHWPFLFFHRLAYAAFRMGQMFLCANAGSLTSSERARLWRAHAAYREELARLLKVEPSTRQQNCSCERSR